MDITVMTIVLTVLVLILAAIVVGIGVVVKKFRQKAEHAGYSSLGDYLRAAPRSDEEMRDAVDLALKGGVISLLGLVFPPFLLIGVIPLYYGARKIAYSSLGLGLVDDSDPESPRG